MGVLKGLATIYGPGANPTVSWSGIAATGGTNWTFVIKNGLITSLTHSP